MTRKKISSLVMLLGASWCALAQPPSTPRAVAQADPDANAYYSFVGNDQAALARWQAEGGDATRYAKDNPNAIYDAMSPERDVGALEFVLKNGANPNIQRHPNLKGTPIFANLMDRDKVALLIKYGADVNVRDYSGYTPLAHVLFSPTSEFKMPRNPRPGQNVRVFTKAELVRFLIDSGAEVNSNLGGWGSVGALALARREDKEVVVLLIERGATLKDFGPGPPAAEKQPANHGPLTIAIELDRDDLALALLGRDKSIAANDRVALLDATRRGFSDVAAALLIAGADPNVTDSKGATPLAWALRRKDAALAAALRTAGAYASVKPFKPEFDARGLDSFGRKVADAIDEVALFDPYRFYLATFEPKRDVAFAFYGNAVKCERAAGFSIVAQQNVQGSVGVGVCVKEATRARDAARSAKLALSQVLSSLAQSVPEPEKLNSLGWKWEAAAYKGGWEGFSFPVVAIGHGILWANTIVLWSEASHRAVIVQADVNQLCEPTSGIRTRIRTPLCDDTTKALADIALAVARAS